MPEAPTREEALAEAARLLREAEGKVDPSYWRQLAAEWLALASLLASAPSSPDRDEHKVVDGRVESTYGRPPPVEMTLILTQVAQDGEYFRLKFAVQDGDWATGLKFRAKPETVARFTPGQKVRVLVLPQEETEFGERFPHAGTRLDQSRSGGSP